MGDPRRFVFSLLVCLLVAGSGGAAHATDFSVTTAADSGAGSLREAITLANASAGPHTIGFNVPVSGTVNIQLATELPQIVRQVTVDGSTQPGYAGVPLILLDGMTGGLDGLRFGAAGAGSRVKALTLVRFNHGVFISFAINVTVEGCYIGTDGTTAMPNSYGVWVNEATGVTIGGETAAARNVISGNTVDGVHFVGTTNASVVWGNYIGLNAAGTSALGNNTGVYAEGAVTIGGSTAARRNVISGSGTSGVIMTHAGVVVVGNYIGTNAAGTAAVPNFFGVGGGYGLIGLAGQGNLISGNTGSGVTLYYAGARVRGNTIGLASDGTPLANNGGIDLTVDAANSYVGGSAAGEGNVVASNRLSGVTSNGANTTVLNNRIGVDGAGVARGNGGAGLRLSAAGATVGLGPPTNAGNIIANNQAGVIVDGAAAGAVIVGNQIYANGDQGISGAGTVASPITLTAVYAEGGMTHFIGTLTGGAPNEIYSVYVYDNAACDGTGIGEGEMPLTGMPVMTNGAGAGTFDVYRNVTVAVGRVITATASRDAMPGTSRFSVCRTVTAPPGPADMTPVPLDFAGVVVDLSGPSPVDGGAVGGNDLAQPGGEVDLATGMGPGTPPDMAPDLAPDLAQTGGGGGGASGCAIGGAGEGGALLMLALVGALILSRACRSRRGARP